ncbi:MAG: hypothetical protein OEW83_18015, partial [Acidimicrobiia bacterium]|nr:hypothetical protein [Acidimicrobiia bacterium]
MTELSYTAWDDNKYQWPPPEGWYQASDGKWWPEGYGPVANQASAETTTVSSFEASSESYETESTSEFAADDAESGEQESFTGIHAEEGGMVEEPEELEGERVTTEFESGYSGAIARGLDSTDDVTAEAVAEEFDEGVETVSGLGATGTSEFEAAAESESGHAVDLDGVASGFADTPDTAYPTESHFDSESRYSTSSAGMAASGFAPRAEGGSSSLGLAGWAQTDASEVRDRVDIGHEYDHTPSDGDTDDLLDPIEVSDDDHDLETSALETSALETSALETSALETSALDTSALEDA